MKSSATFILRDYLPISINKLNGMHFREKMKLKPIAESMVMLAMGLSRPYFVGHVQLTITRCYGKGRRALDIDNIYVKPIVDALRKRKKARRGFQGGLGIIEDDGPGCVDLKVEQRKSEDGQSHTLIHIVGEVKEP